MHVEKNSIVEIMAVGIGAVVALAADGGTPLDVYTTVDEVEIIRVIGPCEVTVTGATFFTTAAV